LAWGAEGLSAWPRSPLIGDFLHIYVKNPQARQVPKYTMDEGKER
jgi:hypothetical protein